MKDIKKLRAAFGEDDYGFAMYPVKISNIKVSRFWNYEDRGGCPYCFPHGIECTNATPWSKRNWKYYRSHQYHIK